MKKKPAGVDTRRRAIAKGLSRPLPLRQHLLEDRLQRIAELCTKRGSVAQQETETEQYADDAQPLDEHRAQPKVRKMRGSVSVHDALRYL